MATGSRPQGRSQLDALLWKTAVSRRRHWQRTVWEAALPLLLASAFTLVPILGGETVVPEKTSVDRAVHLGDPFDTKYAARLCADEALFALVPAGGLGDEIGDFLRGRFGESPRGWPRLVSWERSDDVQEYVTSERYGTRGHPTLCGAVIFENSTAFTLRLNGTIVGNRGAVCGGVDTRRTTTGRAIDSKLTSQDWYLCSGFLALQKLIGEFLASREHPVLRKAWQLDLDVVPFPTPSYKSRAALSATRELIALSVVLFFAYIAGRTTSDIVAEREQKLLEAMKLLGLEDGARFSAYALGSMPLLTLYGLEFAVVLAFGIFANANVVLFCLFFALFGCAVASSALCASALFDNAKTASVTVVVCIFAVSRFGVESPWACLLPPVALVQGLARIVELELVDVGLRWSSMWDDMGFPCSTGAVMLFLAADVGLYLALWVYLEQVVPHRFGAAARPWYRPWPPNSSAAAGGARGHDNGRSASVTRKRVSEKVAGIVQDTLPVACIVDVRSLRKEYFVEGRRTRHRVLAVRSLDLGMAESEILALLGHNGAGKSTTISMLTGLLQPTKGSISVCGHNVSEQPVEARRCLGLCPQHDVLFEDLTASQHLSFAADLRGVGEGATLAASRLLQDVGLCGAVATGAPAGALPSGRRRALGVALALVGDPRFLVLDEPTSGMDPFVRRTMWDLLKQQRSGRAICLSTHYMDEAEMLGDQVCILSRGVVQCYGSPDWLKVRLGSGYLLTLVRAQGAPETASQTAKVALAILRERLPEQLRDEISVTTSTSNEVVARVPFNASREFPSLLRELDSQKEKLGISTVTISATTLEELFVRLADGEADELAAAGPTEMAAAAPSAAAAAAGAAEEPPKKQLSAASAQTSQSLSGSMTESTASGLEAMMGELARASGPPLGGHALGQAVALLVKRWQTVQRSSRSLLCLCLLPFLFNVLGIASIATSFELDSPPLELLATSRDFNPKLALGERLLVPYSMRNGTWRVAHHLKQADHLLQAVVNRSQWDAFNYLPTDAALHKPTSPRPWRSDLQVEASFTGGHELDLDGEVDLSKYVNMKQKGAPVFVIRGVMEKDGFSSAAIERFLSGGGGGSSGGGLVAKTRVMLGLRDRVQGSVDTGGREARLELSFGRAMLRAEAHLRSEVHREELVTCAAGGPAQAVKAEEAMKSLDEETRKLLLAMQEGGAPAFARRAVLEKAGAPAEDVEVLALVSSTEAIPAERWHQLQRCADWQAFAAALLSSTGANAASRYGGFYVESLDLAARRARIAIFQNTTVPHSAPLFLGLLQRVTATPEGLELDREEPPKVSVTNWPLPLTEDQKTRAFSTQGFSFFTMSLIGASFLPASVASDVARELSAGVVRQQAIAGMPMKLFTLVNLAADFVLVVPPLLTQIAFISMFQLAVYVDCLRIITALLVLYGLSAVAQVYAFTPDLRSPTGALNALLALNVVTGFIVATAVWVLSIPFLGSTANSVAGAISFVCRVSPAFNVANALLTIPNIALPGFSSVYGMDPLDWEVAGEPLFALVVNCALYTCLAVRRGIGPGPSIQPDGKLDLELSAGAFAIAEVAEEEKRAREALQRLDASGASSSGSEEGLLLQGLSVTFIKQPGSSDMSIAASSSSAQPRIRSEESPIRRRVHEMRRQLAAEDHGVGPVSLVVPPGTIVGLLGLSGSGKSSALAALAGSLPPSARVLGRVAFAGRRLQDRWPRIGEVGYCPQESELSQGLTVTEHVQLFGRLRGLRGQALHRETRWLLSNLDLSAFEYTLSQNLSGGNQRKLQCACAFIGSPRLICLDEPSAGLDPVARRSLWRTTLATLRRDAVCLLATKCIDEAEALCSRLAILSREGHVSAIGSAADLRARYGGGHEVRMTLKRPMVSEVYSSVFERKDLEAMKDLIGSCVSALGATISSDEGLASFAWGVLFASSPVKSYEQMLAAVHNAPWVDGLEGVRLDTSKELLPEDCEEMKAELALRSERISSTLEGLYPGIQCVEAVSLTRVYQLSGGPASPSQGSRAGTGQPPRASLNVAEVFQSMEANMSELKIADYSIMQTSLEHVFNHLATRQ